MNRRHALVGLAGAASGLVCAAGDACTEEAKPVIPGAVSLSLDKQIRIGASSTPVKVDKTDLHIISVGTGTFRLDREMRLTATLNAAVVQYAKITYWISVAVFDTKGKLLGTAGHKEEVQYTRLGAMPTLFRHLALDFGISKAFKDAEWLVVAISEHDVPKPG